MRTNLEWLNSIEDAEQRDLVQKRIFQTWSDKLIVSNGYSEREWFLKSVEANFFSFMCGAFIWSRSPEGSEYWQEFTKAELKKKYNAGF